MKILVGVCVYNEETKIRKLLEEVKEVRENEEFDVLVCEDGSTDNTNEVVKEFCDKNNWLSIFHRENMGIGATIRDMINYSRENGYDVLAILSGNGKVNPKELRTMYLPVVEEGYDYVKGSRYINGGSCSNLPKFRGIAIPVFSFIVSIFMRKKVTDVTCLVNASKVEIYDDMNIDQEWLNKYELEYYILYYVLKKKMKIKEVPLNLRYPETKKDYSKIKPFSGWWSIIRPWIFLILKIKK